MYIMLKINVAFWILKYNIGHFKMLFLKASVQVCHLGPGLHVKHSQSSLTWLIHFHSIEK